MHRCEEADLCLLVWRRESEFISFHFIHTPFLKIILFDPCCYFFRLFPPSSFPSFETHTHTHKHPNSATSSIAFLHPLCNILLLMLQVCIHSLLSLFFCCAKHRQLLLGKEKRAKKKTLFFEHERSVNQRVRLSLSLSLFRNKSITPAQKE